MNYFATINTTTNVSNVVNDLHAPVEHDLNLDTLEMTIDSNTWKLKEYHVNTMNEGRYVKFSTESSRLRMLDTLPGRQLPTGKPQDIAEALNIDDLVIKATRLSDMEFKDELFQTLKTETIVDKFWSEEGGMFRGTVTMISGDPGAGKTSVLVKQLIDYKKNGAKVGIVSAEMKALDLKRSIARYYPEVEEIDVLYPHAYLAHKELDTNGNPIPFHVAFAAFLNNGYDVVLLDSMKEIQEIFRYELKLTKEQAEFTILDILERNCEGVNREERHTAFLMIQQVGRGGEFVGSQRLVHMINARVEIRKCKEIKGGKYIIFKKNRSGATEIKLYYKLDKAAGVVYDEDRLNAEMELQGLLSGETTNNDSELKDLLGSFQKRDMEKQEEDMLNL